MYYTFKRMYAYARSGNLCDKLPHGDILIVDFANCAIAISVQRRHINAEKKAIKFTLCLTRKLIVQLKMRY